MRLRVFFLIVLGLTDFWIWILVEAIKTPDESFKSGSTPDRSATGRQLVDGQRAFPPEDCGGVPGYERCVQAATGGPDPGGVAEWLGDWHPDDFDLEQVRQWFDR